MPPFIPNLVHSFLVMSSHGYSSGFLNFRAYMHFCYGGNAWENKFSPSMDDGSRMNSFYPFTLPTGAILPCELRFALRVCLSSLGVTRDNR